MKVILTQDHKTLGPAGSTKVVKPGYARNFLFPRELALPATPANVRLFENEKKKRELHSVKALSQAQKRAEELAKLSLTATVAVGEEDRVFGSVTSQSIAELLTVSVYPVDKRDILLDEPIRALGFYTIPVKLHSEVQAQVKVWVIKE